MANPKFPILGTEIPSMIGRTKIMQRLWRELTKKTPSHLSLVGPRFAGKSVLLKALEQRIRSEESPYCAVILWDLGHQTPRSDEEFMKLLCKRLGDGLKKAGNEYGDHLLGVTEGEYGEICEVIDVLYSDAQKLLMLWDGFDKPLIGGKLTRNLWDNLLDLCRKPSFRLVTSSRKELHQLIRDEKSVTSDFWGVFEGIVRVGPFDEQDVNEIIAGLTTISFQPGANTELMNWSAGFPPLLLEIINQVFESQSSGTIDNNLINQAATAACEKIAAMLSSLWDDCPANTKDVYIHLSERGDLPIVDVGKDEQACLLEKGFAQQSGNKLTSSCRMLQQHVKGASPDAGSMARLFGTWEDYKSNIRSLLERRLAQVSRFDDRLHRYVTQAIEDIPDFPDVCLNNLTSIEERAFDLIWQREFGETKIVPQEIIDYWEQVSPYDKIVQRLKEQGANIVSIDRGLQCGILQLLTGSRRGYVSKAKHTTKDTYVLINALHSYRNRTQHAEGEEMHVGVAVAAIMSCLELLSCLDREL